MRYFQVKSEDLVEVKDIDYTTLSLLFIEPQEIKETYSNIGLDLHAIGEINKNLGIHLDVLTHFSCGMIYNIMERESYHYHFITKDRLLIIVAEERKWEELLTIYENMPLKDINLERLTYVLLDKMIVDNYQPLQVIEDQLMELEERILDGKVASFNEIMKRKRKYLMKLRRHYGLMLDIGDKLIENSNVMFGQNFLVTIFHDRVSRLFNHVEMLSEYARDVQTLHDSEIDININKNMKIYTIVTTIFLPLTLIVGWYGMNFVTMKELTWEHGYLYVIGLSIISIILCLVLFKKKKLL